MGKLLFLALLAGGGWWVLQTGTVSLPEAVAPRSEAFETYERFASHLANDRYGQARKLATKGAVRTVQVQELRGRRNTRLGVGRSKTTPDDQVLAAEGNVVSIGYERISETPSTDGSTVTIEAVQQICRKRKACHERRQRAEVCETGDGAWKVCSFRES